MNIHLWDVSWRINDLPDLLAHLSITQLDTIIVQQECTFTPGCIKPLTSKSSIRDLQIEASLPVSVLTGLFSQIDIRELDFVKNCHVLDLSDGQQTEPQASTFLEKSDKFT